MRKNLVTLAIIHIASVITAIVSPDLLTRCVLMSVWFCTILSTILFLIRLPFLLPEGKKFNDYISKRLEQETRQFLDRIVLLEQASITDPLTGVLNRRGGTEIMSSHVARAKRKKSPITVVFLDLDDFKRINDTHGHVVGDLVLARVAEIFHTHLRASDVVARWGGEEFLILLPDTDLEGALFVAHKLRTAVSDIHFPGEIRVTASFGCAEVDSDHFSDAVTAADQQLYQAKFQGKNTVRPLARKKVLDLVVQRT